MTTINQAFAQGTSAARPAASAANNGYYYFETDTVTLYQSNGTAWVQLAAPVTGGSGGTDTNAWHKSGDSFGAAADLGTNDANDVVLVSDATERGRLKSTGELDIGVVGTRGLGNYIVANFRDGDQRLYIMSSSDGYVWNTVFPTSVYRDPNEATGGVVRDPSIMRYNDVYYVAYTNDFSGATPQFSIASSPDLVNWTHLLDLSMTAITGAYHVWAPEWFVDTDGSVHVFVIVSTNSSSTNFLLYETHPTTTSIGGTWSAPVQVTGVPLQVAISSLTESGTTVTVTTSAAHQFIVGQDVTIEGASVAGYNGSWKITAITSTTFTYTNTASGLASATGGTASVCIIDPFVVKIGSTYYLFAKDDNADDKNIFCLSSSALTSGFDTLVNQNITAFGANYEAPCVVQVDSSTWRLYCDKRTDQGIYWLESTDTFATWSAPTLTDSPFWWNHGTVKRVLDISTLRNVLAGFISEARPRGCYITAVSQNIANATTSTVSFSAVTNDDGGFTNLGTYPTRMTAPSPGWYHIGAHVNWAVYGEGKRVIDVRINGTEYVDDTSNNSVNSGTNPNTNPDQTLSVDYFLNTGDYVEITVYQNSTTTVAVNAAQAWMVRYGGY